MPVSLLLCEGGPESPDIRIVSRILNGLCEVRPYGGKYGMGDRILARREAGMQVFGLLDGDFRAWEKPRARPSEWHTKDRTTHFGWRWERKEIENYVIDPSVVRLALGSLPVGYEAALQRAADRVAKYQAARVALSDLRPRFSPLGNEFRISADPTEADCLRELKRLAREWNDGRSLDEASLCKAFQSFLPECTDCGARREAFLTGFAGKDLLRAMSDDLNIMGFHSPAVFQEKVLSAIQGTAGDVATWLPEWRALREIVGAQA